MNLENKKRIIVVLGMHRSGTSAITRGLQALGLNLGNNLRPPMPGDNDKGFYEDIEIANLNDDLLNALHSNWDSLSLIPSAAFTQQNLAPFELRAVELLRAKMGDQLFAFKDPRTARLLSFWHPVFNHLNVIPSYVIVVRHPMSVVKSLQKRNGFDNEKGYYLWLEHVLPSILDTAGARRVVVDYDMMIDDPMHQLERLALALDCPFTLDSITLKEYVSTFLDEALRHARFSFQDFHNDLTVPLDVINAYEVLLRLARAELNIDEPEVMELFAQLHSRMQYLYPALRYITRLEERIAECHAKITGLNQTVAHRDVQVVESHRQITDLESALRLMKASKSWQLTAPLRWSSDQVQRAINWTTIKNKMRQKPRTRANVIISRILEKDAAKIRFPKPPEKPMVSIIIPVFNQWQYTINCLKSLSEHTDGNYEVILVDDASTDKTSVLFSNIPNLRMMRNQDNSGFIYSANRGANASEADYILFLNNDTQVTHNWLPPLLELIAREDVAAVGPKLVYSEGSLQAAGVIVWSDGNIWPYGHNDEPDKPEYNYVREVDYCTGACLLVKRELFQKLGGFDTRYKPAFYDDPDLCFALRSLGYKIMYQPRSLVTHFEAVTYGLDSSNVRYSDINRHKFVEKWIDVLEKSQYASQTVNIPLARDRRDTRRVLVLDDRIPAPDQGSGFPRAYQLLNLLAELQYNLTFFPLGNTTPYQPYTNALQQIGIEMFYGKDLDFTEFAESRFGHYGVVLVSRPYLMEKAFPLIRKFFPDALLIYDAEALFSSREILKAQIRGTTIDEHIANQMFCQELDLMKKADLVITVSQREQTTIIEKTGLNNVVVWGYPITASEPACSFIERSGILFVGSFIAGEDSPNEDAILYFTQDIFKLIKNELACRFFIVGNSPTKAIQRLASPSITVTGHVPDIKPYYDRCRIFVVPHRYSAGIPLKLIEAMSYGIPCVVSDLTAKQLNLTDGKEVLVAQNAADFSDKIARLYRDKELWYYIQRTSLDFIRRECHPEHLRERLKKIIDGN